MFNWLSFLSYAVVTAVTPGPNNIMAMSQASRLGFRKSYPFNLGIWVGFSLVMLACTFLCNALSQMIPRLKTPMIALGTLYMLWLAAQTLKSEDIVEAQTFHGGFFAGLALQFINPKIYIYCMVSMEAYILPFYQGQWIPLAGFAMLLALIGFLFTICWSLFGSVMKRLFSRNARIIRGVMAGLLALCAVSLWIS